MLKVFVYGTLRRGEPNNFFLENLGVKFLSKAITVEKFPMIIATKFNLPFMIDKEGTGYKIEGEVYEINEKHLPKLDEFELCPEIYQRKLIHIEIDKVNAVAVQCFTYLLPYLSSKLLDYPLISNYAMDQGSKNYDLNEDLSVEHIQLLIKDS